MTKLHQQLQQDCIYLGKLDLCQLLLMNDSQYPWCILVPDRDNIKEIHELTTDEQILLVRESSLLASGMMEAYSGDKMNIAALGNVVPQLHIHHIVRFRSDPAWPAPIWGKFPAQPYSDEVLKTTVNKLYRQFADSVNWSNPVRDMVLK